MSYIEHEWTSGELVTADKLNNMEEGIAEMLQNNSATYATITFIHDTTSFLGQNGYYITGPTYCNVLIANASGRLDFSEVTLDSVDSITIPIIGGSMGLSSFYSSVRNDSNNGGGWVIGSLTSSSGNITIVEDYFGQYALVSGDGSLTISWYWED